MQGIEPPYTDPYVRWCERSTSQLMASLLLDFTIMLLIIHNKFLTTILNYLNIHPKQLIEYILFHNIIN